MTEPVTRAAYDAVAVLYADTFRNALDDMPLDRALIAAFAELVQGTGPVADLGCGPGRLTGHLASLGLPVFGIDLSPGMIAQAREEHPDLRFDEGTITDLDIPDDSLGGVLAWFSTIHLSPGELPKACSELHRGLAPGGHLLIAFQSCDGDTPQPFDHKVSLAYRWPLDPFATLLRRTGLIEIARLLREPLDNERFPAGHLLLRKPT